MQSIDTESRHDLGVLFVHGIGQARQGMTLSQCGESLCDAVAWTAQPAAAGTPVRASVTAAWLTDPAPTNPACAELLVDGACASVGASQSGSSRWLLAEAWWAEKFIAPSYREVTSWSFEILPATLLAHADRRFRRAGFELMRVQLGQAPVQRLPHAMVRVLMEGLVVTLTLALTPVLLVMIALLLVLALPPFTLTREWAGALQRLIAATVGDSQVFMGQPIAAAAITTTVRERLEWLAQRCRKVVVVAHSQGGAIAHKVLRGPVTAPCDVFISYGSGLAKLTDIGRGDIQRGQGKLWYSAAGGSLATVAMGWVWWQAAHMPAGGAALLLEAMRTLLVVELMVIALMGWFASRGDTAPGRAAMLGFPVLASAAVTGVLVMLEWVSGGLDQASVRSAIAGQAAVALGLGAAFAALAGWQSDTGRSMDPQMQSAIDRQLFTRDFGLPNRRWMRWLDLFAAADPVPNGRLLDDVDPDGMVSIEVVNRGSLLTDHTSYWQSADDFVQRVSRVLLGQAGLAVRPLAWPKAALRRRWRVGIGAFAQLLVLVALVILSASWAVHPPAEMQQVLQWIDVQPAADATKLQRTWAALKVRGLPLAAGALVGLTALVWLAWAVRRWHRNELATFLAGDPFVLGTPSLASVLLAPLAMSMGVAIVIIGPSAGWIAVGFAMLLVLARVPQLRDALHLKSQSGVDAELATLERAAQRRALLRAKAQRDSRGCVAAAQALEALDPAAAREGLSFAAVTLKDVSAAWALGRMLERAAVGGVSADEQATLRRDALRAYERGAELGDAASAWWGASLAKTLQRPDDASRLHQRAFDLGDAMSAHTLGQTALEARVPEGGRRAEGRMYLEEGVRRGDALSANFLAGHHESIARASEGVAAENHFGEAVRLYRLAFDWGHVGSALQAGQLLRRRGQIARARRAFTMAMRLRDASAALALGDLERDDEQDAEAARRAYVEALSLGAQGREAAQALLGLGGLLEQQRRPQAAMQRYRDALALPGAEASARAGLALATLIEANDKDRPRDEAEAALHRATELSPTLAADALITFLHRQNNGDAALALGPAQLVGASTAGLRQLAELLRRRDPPRSLQLLEQAFAQGQFGEAAHAVAADLLERYGDGSDPAAQERVVAEVVARGSWHLGQVAEMLEQRQQGWLAAQLRRRVADVPVKAAATTPFPPQEAGPTVPGV